jgi:curved DNA-binding protein CbpA
MKFFTITEDTTPDALRRRYRQLCRQHHPDKGGDNETQAQINDEYERRLRNFRQWQRAKVTAKVRTG